MQKTQKTYTAEFTRKAVRLAQDTIPSVVSNVLFVSLPQAGDGLFSKEELGA